MSCYRRRYTPQLCKNRWWICATDILSYNGNNIEAQIRKLTYGECVDAVIIAGGNAATLNQATAMTKLGGIVSKTNYFDGAKYSLFLHLYEYLECLM